MRQLAAHLLSHAQAAHPGMVELQRPLWVSKMQGDAATCKWKLIGALQAAQGRPCCMVQWLLLPC
jgi:hypothetical protein